MIFSRNDNKKYVMGLVRRIGAALLTICTCAMLISLPAVSVNAAASTRKASSSTSVSKNNGRKDKSEKQIQKSDSTPEKTIRVGFVQTENFMRQESNSVKSGFAYDYLQTVSYYNNWKYQYVYGDWSTMVDKLENGEIDVLAGVSKSEDRDGKILFPDEPMGEENEYIYMSSRSSRINDDFPDALKGLRVAANKNTLTSENLDDFNDRQQLGMQITTFENSTESFKAMYEGKVDAVAASDILLPPNNTDVPVAYIGRADYYLAVSPKRPDILQDLNKTLNELHSSEPNFPQSIQEKYFGHVIVGKNLNAQEQAWLSEHKTLRIGYSDNYEPFCYTSEKGKAKGVLPDILRGSFEEMSPDVKLKFKSYQSYNRMLSDLKKGKLDVIAPILDQPYFSETNHIYQTGDAIEVHMQMIYRGSYNKAKSGKLVVTSRNQSQAYYTNYYYPDNKKYKVDSLADGLKAIDNGKADAMIVNSYAANVLLHDESDFKSTPLVRSVGLCFGVRRGDGDLVSVLNRGIDRYGQENIEASLVRNTEQGYHITLSAFMRQHMIAFGILGMLIIALIFVLIAWRMYNRQKGRMLYYLAHFDSVTSLHNRRSYDEAVSILRKRLPENTVVVEADINGLKATNDGFGHEAGDELIRGAAECLLKSLAPDEYRERQNFAAAKKVGLYDAASMIPKQIGEKDVLNDGEGSVFRTGGDEFVAIFFADKERTDRMLDNLNEAVSEWKGLRIGGLSISTGVAAVNDYPDEDIDGLMREVDKQMYKSKAAYYQQPGHSRRH